MKLTLVVRRFILSLTFVGLVGPMSVNATPTMSWLADSLSEFELRVHGSPEPDGGTWRGTAISPSGTWHVLFNGAFMGSSGPLHLNYIQGGTTVSLLPSLLPNGVYAAVFHAHAFGGDQLLEHGLNQGSLFSWVGSGLGEVENTMPGADWHGAARIALVVPDITDLGLWSYELQISASGPRLMNVPEHASSLSILCLLLILILGQESRPNAARPLATPK